MRVLRMTCGEESFLEDTIDLMFFTLYLRMKQDRYITRQPYRSNGLSAWLFYLDLQSDHENDHYRSFLTDQEFLQKYRLTRKAFKKLLSLIEEHPVFHTPAAGPNQLPPQYQLMIFLKYLGTEGTGNSNSDLRNMFRIGRGTNDLYKARVSKAIRSLRSQYYTWPDRNERRMISSRIQKLCSLPNCVGFVDGAMNPLSTKP